jgi:putative DNA-invertase from lambdoid prophage Rac
MSQTSKKAVIYARVSTSDQDCGRQVADLQEFATNRGYEVVEVIRETASGAKNDRKERARVMQLARHGKINAILVTELSRWGRNTQDLLTTLQQLAEWSVSVIAMNGLDFDLSSATGKLMVTIVAGVSTFERDLLAERVRSGMKVAKAAGKHVGRPSTTHKHAAAVLAKLEAGLSVRETASALKISPTTVQKIKAQST